jgi:hypothetical protein
MDNGAPIFDTWGCHPFPPNAIHDAFCTCHQWCRQISSPLLVSLCITMLSIYDFYWDCTVFCESLFVSYEQ